MSSCLEKLKMHNLWALFMFFAKAICILQLAYTYTFSNQNIFFQSTFPDNPQQSSPLPLSLLERH